MAYRKNFRPMPEPQFPQGPENPSTATTLHFGELKVDRSFESRRTFELFKINKAALIGGALKAATSSTVPVTEQNLKDALEKGKRFRDLFPPDGPSRACHLCFKEKQPVITTYFYQKDGKEVEGHGGNFFARSEKAIKEGTPAETQKASNELTAEIFGGKIPEDLLSRALHVCKECQWTANKAAEKAGNDPVFTRGFNFSQAREKLLEMSERISLAKGRGETRGRVENIAANLGRRSRTPQTEGGRGGFRGQGQRGERPKEERVEYPVGSGAYWFKSTGDKIQQAVENGDLDSIDPLGVICDMSPVQIFKLGFVEFEGQAPFVQGIAIAAKERLEKVAAVSRHSGTGTAPLGKVAEHGRRERENKSRGGGKGKKGYREPIRNPEHDYDR